VRSYDYAHREGVLELSWEDVGRLARELTESLARAALPDGVDVVVGVARGGLFPATAVAAGLRRELWPVRLSRRVDDEVRFERPVWYVPVPAEVAGTTVAIVDDVVDTGETLALVAEQARAAGARRVVTGCLVDHGWARPRPETAALVTEAFVIFPWDREVLIDGRWQAHPEIAAGFQAQGRPPRR
jgi:hypoxanthine phosphoribosyltransferase